VQGSSKLPHVMDDAAIDLVESLEHKLGSITEQEFVMAKKKSFDSILNSRFDLSSLSDKYFTKIIEQDYKFFNFIKMDNYSKSLRREDLVKFYNDVFIEQNLKMTVYVKEF
jgi:hypothetical protein